MSKSASLSSQYPRRVVTFFCVRILPRAAWSVSTVTSFDSINGRHFCIAWTIANSSPSYAGINRSRPESFLDSNASRTPSCSNTAPVAYLEASVLITMD